MQLHPSAAVTAVLISLVFLLPGAPVEAHNITSILSSFPDFSTFNHYLTITHLADEINNRNTITVCAVNNAAMSDLLNKHHLSVYAMKNVLSLHVLLDYFGAKKLHEMTNGNALTATMFQATGTPSGSSGFVNITDMKGGKVGFGSVDSGKTDATFVKTLREIAYNISVIHISSVLPSSQAEAPTPEPAAPNIISIMSAHGCKSFADALLENNAVNTYTGNIEGGLTVFCPKDDAFKQFQPKFKNLTAGGKQSLLEYHGVPIYQSMSMLRSSNGLMNTLATDGASKYDFTVQNDGQDITLITSIVTARIVGTLIDKQPLVIFTIDKVLLPKELFKKAVSPAPAPAPEADAPTTSESPKSSKKKHRSPPAPASLESPADSPDDASAEDQEADSNNAVEIKGFNFGAMVLSIWFASLVM